MKWALAVFALGALAQQQQPPRLASGHVVETAAGPNLGQQIRSFAGPAWVGYSIAAVPGHRGCCYSINNGFCSYGCALEGGSIAGQACPANGSPDDNTAFLEGERIANILVRVDKGEVEKVQVYSPTCQLDIGSLTLHWLTGVDPAASVAFLRSLSLTGTRVVSAIGAHVDPSADAFLREIAGLQTAQKRDRERAATLLASTRGPAGLAIVMKLLKDDPDEQFRSTLPGAIAQAPSGGGTSALIDLATKDQSRKVRERAFFWLGRSKDPRAQRFVEEILAK
jgi:hypothetical protein